MAKMSDRGEYGPKMRALTPLRQRFVLALLENGNSNYTAAYRAASELANDHVCRVEGHRLGHDERIKEAMHEVGQRTLGTGALAAALKRLKQALEDLPPGDPQGMKAVQLVLDRAGLNAVTEHKVTVEHLGQDPEMLERIRALAIATGMDMRRALGRGAERLMPITIDGTATVVVEEPVPAILMDGLEDIL